LEIDAQHLKEATHGYIQMTEHWLVCLVASYFA
jgi:hypothetical protein